MLKNIFSPLISSFSKPKWQSKNAETRIQGILESLEPGNPELESIAINDENSDVKICAINRIIDLEAIQQVIKKTSNPNLKNEPTTKAAHDRFSKILSAETFPIADIVDRLEVLRGSIPPKICDYIASHGKEEELRLIVLDKIKRDSLLGDIALKDDSFEVRLKAVKLINKKSTLQRVCKKSRSKNKKIYQQAKQRLEQLIEDENRPVKYTQESINICEQLDKLYKRQLLRQEIHTFNQLKQDWNKVKNFANNDNTKRYEKLVDKIELTLVDLKQEEYEIKQKIEQLENLLLQLSQSINDYLETPDNGTELKEIQKLQQQWLSLIGQLDNSKSKQLTAKYLEMIKLLEITTSEDKSDNTSNHIYSPVATFESLEQSIKQAQNLLSQNQTIGQKLVSNLLNKIDKDIKQIESSNITQSGSDFNQLKDKYASIKSKLTQKLDDQKQQKSQFIQNIQQLVNQINQHIESGETEQAIKLRQQFQDRLDETQLLTKHEKSQQLEGIKETQQQLSQLSSWKNWANDYKRESLSSQAQEIFLNIEKQLNELPENIESVYQLYAAQIKDLRSQWKLLKGPSNKHTWEAFNNYCNQSFELFQPYIEQLESIKQKNVETKKKLCAQLQQYVEHMNWNNNQELTDKDFQETDWKQVDNILKQANKEWRAIGKINHNDHQKLHKQFKQSQQIINHQLNQVWDKNAAKFKQLIDEANQLVEISEQDLNKAISECKRIQANWKRVGPTRQKIRKVLWNKFRQSCDLVFNKREQARETLKQEDESKQLEKTALCENLEALNQQNLNLNELQKAFSDINESWQKIEQNRNKKEPLNLRFKEAIIQYQNKVSQLEILAEQENIKHLKDKADFCQEIEQKATLSEEELDILDKQWHSLTVISDKTLEKQITARYEQAIKNNADSNYDELVKQKEKLCLAMEILTESPSPIDKEQDRMNFKIEQLNDKLQQNNNEEVLTANQLLISWYLLPCYKINELEGLSQRFFKAYEN
ncbi:MAG: DUF349 domain-containing protein [Gammaproteobacteria bacterium]|nr:DUF349 domain-containing protein [Gammaproteobacteria bacterium]